MDHERALGVRQRLRGEAAARVAKEPEAPSRAFRAFREGQTEAMLGARSVLRPTGVGRLEAVRA